MHYLSPIRHSMYNQFDLLIDSYLLNNIGVDDNFLSESLSAGLHDNIIQLQKDNLMVAAGIGNNEIKDANQKMRGDKIYWMDKSHDNIFEQAFLHRIDDFIERLNSTCYTGINGYEFHYAVYEEGVTNGIRTSLKPTATENIRSSII